jgi:hypothetical protein
MKISKQLLACKFQGCFKKRRVRLTALPAPTIWMELPELPLRPERQHHRPDRSERRRHRYIPVRPLRRTGEQNRLNRHPLPLQRTVRGDDR